jgi:hypothetical protein
MFDLAAGQPLLVKATTPATAEDAGAMVAVSFAGARTSIGLLPAKTRDLVPFGMGKVFSIPLGPSKSASLLIANVSSGDMSVDVWTG